MPAMLHLAALALFLAAAPAAPPLLTVTGALPKTGALTLADLEAMKPVTATWESGGKHQVYGVPLERVLTRFGFDPGTMGPQMAPADKRKGWKLVVIASAPDGFAAVLSCAEIFESMGATRALVIWKMDGKPLPADRGPLRLAVLTDKEPSRSVHGLTKLELVDPRGPAKK